MRVLSLLLRLIICKRFWPVLLLLQIFLIGGGRSRLRRAPSDTLFRTQRAPCRLRAIQRFYSTETSRSGYAITSSSYTRSMVHFSKQRELAAMRRSTGPNLCLSTHASRHGACVAAMECLRQAYSAYLASVHDEIRLRLSGGARINQLPVDVLVHIFSALPLKGRLKATHVCRQWCIAGLEAPALWTQINVTGPAYAAPTSLQQLLLSRSKAAKLDIRLRLGPGTLSRDFSGWLNLCMSSSSSSPEWAP